MFALNQTLVLPLYTLIHGDGISTILPFEGYGQFDLSAFTLLIMLPLRSDLLRADCRCSETFLHFGVQAFHLNRCYYHQDRH